MAGRVYDIDALNKLDATLQFQENQFVNIDKEQKSEEKKILRYATILGGSVVILVALSLIISIKKK